MQYGIREELFERERVAIKDPSGGWVGQGYIKNQCERDTWYVRDQRSIPCHGLVDTSP